VRGSCAVVVEHSAILMLEGEGVEGEGVEGEGVEGEGAVGVWPRLLTAEQHGKHREIEKEDEGEDTRAECRCI
jgi:hypothetical protein